MMKNETNFVSELEGFQMKNRNRILCVGVCVGEHTGTNILQDIQYSHRDRSGVGRDISVLKHDLKQCFYWPIYYLVGCRPECFF